MGQLVKRIRGCPDTALTPGRRTTLAHEPEEADFQQNPGRGSDDEVIAEALQLLADFDNTPLPHMTPLFYQHGYEELRMITRDLLRILGHDPDAQKSG
jgi:hypothetical protein